MEEIEGFIVGVFVVIGVIFLLLVLICLLIACISFPFKLTSLLVSKVEESNKCNRFFKLAVIWLTFSYKLPFRMYERGIKQALLGFCLMLVSPAAISTYGITYYITYNITNRRDQINQEIASKKERYKSITHENIVTLTDLQDFPAFYWGADEPTLVSDTVYCHYNFDKPLSNAYLKKLDALCQDSDNNFDWSNVGDKKYQMSRWIDGKHVKLGDFVGQMELYINQKGFTLKGYPGSASLAMKKLIETLEDPKKLKQHTGVTLPKFEVKAMGGDYGFYECDLRLDKKVSNKFIKQLKNSPKWEAGGDGKYYCKWKEDNTWYCMAIEENRSWINIFFSWHEP